MGAYTWKSTGFVLLGLLLHFSQGRSGGAGVVEGRAWVCMHTLAGSQRWRGGSGHRRRHAHCTWSHVPGLGDPALSLTFSYHQEGAGIFKAENCLWCPWTPTESPKSPLQVELVASVACGQVVTAS